HGPVHQELRALADIRERGLQLMRYVPEEPIALVRQIEQTLPQPLELAAEALEVVGTRHRDRIGEGALAELADGAVELAQRPADAEGEDEDGDERERPGGRRAGAAARASRSRAHPACGKGRGGWIVRAPGTGAPCARGKPSGRTAAGWRARPRRPGSRSSGPGPPDHGSGAPRSGWRSRAA